jgi:hypothetical protein
MNRHRRRAAAKVGIRGNPDNMAIPPAASQESAANWAPRALAAKNRLGAEDAKLLEEAFEKRLSELLLPESAEVENVDPFESLSAGWPGGWQDG